MNLFQRVRRLVMDNQILIVLLALILGVIFPRNLSFLNSFSTAFLIAIFFVSSLRLDWDELKSYFKDWRMLLFANAVMLIMMPFAMWLPPHIYAPDWALAFLIVGAAPTGLTIALVADIFGGKQGLAMVIAVTTSVLAPFTIPLVLKVALGQSVEFPVFNMLWTLFSTMVLPFIAAMALKSRAKKFVQKHDAAWRETSLLLFGLLIAGVTASSVSDTGLKLGWNDLGIVIVMTVFMGGIAWFSYATTRWRTPAERITIALCMVYMNNTVALFVGDRYFPGQDVVPKLIVILTAVNLLLPPIKWAASRVLKTEVKKTNPFAMHAA